MVAAAPVELVDIARRRRPVRALDRDRRGAMAQNQEQTWEVIAGLGDAALDGRKALGHPPGQPFDPREEAICDSAVVEDVIL